MGKMWRAVYDDLWVEDSDPFIAGKILKKLLEDRGIWKKKLQNNTLVN